MNLPPSHGTAAIILEALTVIEKMNFGSNLDLVWRDDPKLFGMRCARYKFVAKMLAGYDQVMEVGAGDGVLGHIVEKAVKHLLKTDMQGAPGVKALNLVKDVHLEYQDAIYALDVLEHVRKQDEDAFMTNLCNMLKPAGTCIIGMPSLESQKYASPHSKAGHVNCKTEDQLRALMQKYFQCVYLFTMHDEIIGTSFGPMAHYRIAVCNTKREKE